jgi:RimJ/RimL family protein N-acetyltransferase
MLNFDLVLESSKVLLKPLVEEDFIALKRNTGDSSLWTYFTEDLSDADVLREWIDEGIEATRDKKRLALSITDKVSGKVIGSTSIGSISIRDKRVEIGWTWISLETRGTGLNAYVKHLLLEYLFEIVGCERVEFKTDVLNMPARKALKKIGATEEGILRSHTLMTHGRRRRTIFYGILRMEWPVIKQVMGNLENR